MSCLIYPLLCFNFTKHKGVTIQYYTYRCSIHYAYPIQCMYKHQTIVTTTFDIVPKSFILHKILRQKK